MDVKPFDCAELDRFVKALPDGLVWDVGCGPGDVTRYLGARRDDVVGLDLSPIMVDVARQLDPAGRYVVADMRYPDTPSGSLAGVVAFYSLIHVEPSDLPAMLARWFDVVVPGGKLLVAVHQGDHILHMDSMFGGAVDLDFHFFVSEGLARLLSEAGFSIDDVRMREPHPEIEAQTRRVYVHATRPLTHP